MPVACAAMPIRPAVSAVIALPNPSPSAPSSASATTATSSKMQVARIAGVNAELLGDFFDAHARRAEPSIRNALTPFGAGTAGAKHPHDDARVTAVRAPLLASVETVAVAVAPRGRANRRGIGSGVGFGQREAREDVAAGELRKPARFCSSLPSLRIAEQIIECTETVTAVPRRRAPALRSASAYET